MKFLTLLAVLPILAVNAAPAPDSQLAARGGCAATVTASALKCRTGPGTKYTAVRQYSKGRSLFFRCQDYGEMGWWGKTDDGCFVDRGYVEIFKPHGKFCNPPEC